MEINDMNSVVAFEVECFIARFTFIQGNFILWLHLMHYFHMASNITFCSESLVTKVAMKHVFLSFMNTLDMST